MLLLLPQRFKIGEVEGEKSLSCVFATPWTIQSMEFSRPQYWSRGSPGDLPNPGIKPSSPKLQEDSLLSKPLEYVPKYNY